MLSLCLYHQILQDPLFLLYQNAQTNPSEYGEFYRNLYDFALKQKWQDRIWQRYLFRLVLTGENIFTNAAARIRGNQINPILISMAKKELQAIKDRFDLPEQEAWQLERAFAANFYSDAVEKDEASCSQKGEEDCFCPIENQLFLTYFEAEIDSFLLSLMEFHQQYGYGNMVLNHCWLWQGEQLQSVVSSEAMNLEEIIGYEQQKNAVLENTEILLNGYPANHLLLYGERGTGKSSLVKAVARRYQDRKLKLIEISREALRSIGGLIDKIRQYPYFFILFLDDLSFEQADEDYKILKNLLDGGVKAIPENMVIYATSNRKHLVKETWQDRNGEEEISKDGLTEKLSLSHRFGKTITFAAPSQEEYLRIVQELGVQYQIKADWEILSQEALLWERRYHSRSGRTAIQFIRDFAGREQLAEKRNML